MSPATDLRAFHLDLNGLPPTIDRLLQLLRIAAAGGYNATLIEWEDTFPWKCDPRYRAAWAYSEADVARLNDEAAKLGIEIIPLVQCLGHMETPLTIKDNVPLREEAHSAQVLSPAAPGARRLVQQMVDDVLALSTPRWFHLGGDEARSLGKSQASQDFLAAGGTKAQLYLQHVEPILDALIARGVRPILWHDMMSTWEAEAIQQLAQKCDLMVWGYGQHPDATRHHYRREVIETFGAACATLWSACAFKGADGSNRDLPDLAKRCDNALAWAQVAQRHGFTGGAVATGWSRYSTHRLQCEPIDGALDALLAVGVIMRDGLTVASAPPAPIARLESADVERLHTAARETLRTLGELESFDACHAALQELQTARSGAWETLRDLREQLAVIDLEPARAASGMASDSLYHAARLIAGAVKAAIAVHETLKDKVQPACVETYLRERLAPLESQLAELAKTVARVEPDAFAFVRERLKEQGIGV
jgi:hexosaminidase